jgi:hypothetical protein
MDDILSLLQDFDVANFLPEPDKFMSSLVGWVRLIILAGPLMLLILGLWYRFVEPKKPGSKIGFPLWVTIGSVQAWNFAQRLCNSAYLVIGGGLSALMLVISLFFNKNHGLAMVNIALVCVIVELIVIVIVCFTINALVQKAYDKDGKPKKRR